MCSEQEFITRFSGSQYGRSPRLPIKWNCNTMCLRSIVRIIHPNDSFVNKKQLKFSLFTTSYSIYLQSIPVCWVGYREMLPMFEIPEPRKRIDLARSYRYFGMQTHWNSLGQNINKINSNKSDFDWKKRIMKIDVNNFSVCSTFL